MVCLVVMNPNTESADYNARLSTFVQNSKIDRKVKSIFCSVPATILCLAGFTYTGQQVKCLFCGLEPDILKALHDVDKASVSITLVLIILHLQNECKMAISCLESFLSIDASFQIAYNNVIKLSKLNEFKSEIINQVLQRNDDICGGYKITQPIKVHDNLDFETLARRCKDKTNMRSAEARLLTFKNWKYSNIVTPLALSYDGFYKHENKQDDSVKCVYCGQILYKWEKTDIVSKEHIDNSPNCPLKKAPQLSAEEPFNEIEVYYHRCLLVFADESFKQHMMTLPTPDATSFVARMVNLFVEKKDFCMLTNNAVLEKLSGKEISLQRRKTEKAVDDLPLQFDEHSKYFHGISDKKKKNEFEKMSLTEIQSEISKMNEENTRLRESKLCKICIDKDIDTVFLPCGHLVSCRGCAPKIKNCAVCRTLIRGTVLAFIP